MKPPKFRFYLEKKNKDASKQTEEELIMVSISYGYSRISTNGKKRSIPCRIALEDKIAPRNFGKVELGFKFDNTIFERYSRSNKTILLKMNRLKEAVWKLESKYLAGSIMPKPKVLKEDLLLELNRKDRVDNISLSILEFLKDDIKRYEDGVGRNTFDKLKPNTIKTYKTLETLIEEFEISTEEVLRFENLDENKYWQFWDVTDEILRGVRKVYNPNRSKRQTKKEEGYSVNSIRKYQDALIKTLNRAKVFDLITPLVTTKAGLKLPSADGANDAYITIKELEKVIKSDVSYDISLKKAKHYIIISCLTGMRYQSMADTTTQKVLTFNDEHLNFQYINSRQFKTNTEVCMPLLKPVRDILNSYDGEFPKWPANGTINKKLKKLFELLEIDAPTKETVVTYSSGSITREKPKFKLITTHSGRRSFITNLEELKVNRDVVDQITHPDKKPKNPMRKIYDKRDLLSKAKDFVHEVNRLESDIYFL